MNKLPVVFVSREISLFNGNTIAYYVSKAYLNSKSEYYKSNGTTKKNMI